MTSAVNSFIAVARSTLGTRERSDGWTKYGQWYADNVANQQAFATADWCDMWVSWCARQVGLQDVVGQFAYTPWHAEWFYKQGLWGQTPKVGAIVFFDWAGTKVRAAIDHVAIVEAVEPTGAIITLEGNSVNNNVQRTRRSTGIAGYGYPKYPQEVEEVMEPQEVWSHTLSRPDYAADVIKQETLNAGAWLRTAAIQSWRARLAAEASQTALTEMAKVIAELASNDVDVDPDAIVRRIVDAIEAKTFHIDIEDGPSQA